jgi:hypothetical protein
MADEPCKECLRLQKAYRYALRACYRLDSKLKDAMVLADLETFQQLSKELDAVEALRAGTRAAVQKHQSHLQNKNQPRNG